jgi:hypothetical protein
VSPRFMSQSDVAWLASRLGRMLTSRGISAATSSLNGLDATARRSGIMVSQRRRAAGAAAGAAEGATHAINVDITRHSESAGGSHLHGPRSCGLTRHLAGRAGASPLCFDPSPGRAGGRHPSHADFKESLPVIKEALDRCQFYAIDCEM